MCGVILQDSDLERALRKQEDKSSGAALQRWRWFYVALIGITVALLSMVVNLGIAGLNSLKIKTTERIVTNSGGTVHQTIAHQRLMHSLAISPCLCRKRSCCSTNAPLDSSCIAIPTAGSHASACIADPSSDCWFSSGDGRSAT